MLRVGLTGGIATGKSTVGQMFVELGCHFIDADRIVRQLFEPGQAVHNAVVQAFGDSVIASDGTVDRKVLGAIVFKDPQARAKLNSLVHPATIQYQLDWLVELEVSDPQGIGIVEAALMIEVGTYKNYDKLIVASCSTELQKQRLRSRTGLSDDQIDARIQAQMPIEEKVKYADYVIDTSGDFTATRSQVSEVNSKLREFAARTSRKRRS
jgi:dephospho-CoA kinase